MTGQVTALEIPTTELKPPGLNLIFFFYLPLPHAAGINNKLKKKQNKGGKQRTGGNNGGVDLGDVVEKLLIHDQKKSRNICCSGIGFQITLSTA